MPPKKKILLSSDSRPISSFFQLTPTTTATASTAAVEAVVADTSSVTDTGTLSVDSASIVPAYTQVKQDKNKCG